MNTQTQIEEIAKRYHLEDPSILTPEVVEHVIEAEHTTARIAVMSDEFLTCLRDLLDDYRASRAENDAFGIDMAIRGIRSFLLPLEIAAADSEIPAPADDPVSK